MIPKSAQKLLLVLLLIVTVIFTVGCGTNIPSGHRAVFYSRFGGGTEYGKVYSEGFQWHMPWNNFMVYQIQLQERKESLTMLASDGATIQMDVSVLFHPDPTKLDSLQGMIGPNYYDVKVAPTIRGVGRAIAGRFKPEEIYSTRRDELNKVIFDECVTALEGSHVTMENLFIRDVKLPEKISEAINFKLAAQQEAQRMEFTIQKEKLEADRKRIEAQGISDFQKIVASGVTPSLLKWKGIEATEKLAASPNSKIIVIGNGDSQLPIILGGDK